MKVLKSDKTGDILKVTFEVPKAPFNAARKDAYIRDCDRYPVPGVAGGLATIEDLERTYGPAVLYDEALNLLIPQTLNGYLTENHCRIMGKPVVKDVSFLPGGGVTFEINADLYPEVKLGQYKGIAVPYDRTRDAVLFERAVLQRGCEQMEGNVPMHMIDQKLNTMAAQEKLNVNNDSVYHLLADITVILKKAYEMTGTHRPIGQIRTEAMDIMLQTVTRENPEDDQAFLKRQLMDTVARYRDLPEGFENTLDGIIEDRRRSKAKMNPEEMSDEIFKAYLGSLDLDEKEWRRQRRTGAAKSVCCDLFLDEVAAAEKMSVSDEEVWRVICNIAEQCEEEIAKVEAHVDRAAIRASLLRDKARAFVVEHAVFRAEE